MQVIDGYGLGCWLDHNDPRSRDFVYTRSIMRTTMQSVTHRLYAPALDQGEVGACVGFSVAQLLNTSRFYKARQRCSGSRRRNDNEDGYDFYRHATRLDEWNEYTWEPDDFGSSVLAGAKAMRAKGCIDRYEWAWDMDGFLAALQRQPVMVGTLWTSGMFDPDATGLVRPTGELVGGHAYLAYGVSFGKRRVRLRNHWTSDWGVDGDCFIDFDDMEWLIEQQGEILVPIPV